jgi:hypothetical protein
MALSRWIGKISWEQGGTLRTLMAIHLTPHTHIYRNESRDDSPADIGRIGAGAPVELWKELLADDAAIDRIARRLMAAVSEEIDAVSLPSLERARELIEDLILAGAEETPPSL